MVRVELVEWRAITCINTGIISVCGCSLLGDRLHAISVNHDSNANAEIVLCAIKQSRRVVVELNHSHIESIARTNVDATTKCPTETCFCHSSIRARAGNDLNAKDLIEPELIASVCYTHKRVSERLKCLVRRVVFQLNAAKKIEETRVDVQSGGRSR